MSVEEDDPVVSEVNVYVSQRLAEHVCVFQYPNRPACYSRNQQELLKAKIKPVQNKVELELSLPMDGGNYSNSKGESIVSRIECGINDSNYERGMMDKHILMSKSVDVATNRYAIAILKDGELHLVPLKKILQLHPDFGYLDKAVLGDQKMAKEREGTETEEEEEEARPVQVQIARVKSERAEAARKASYHYQQQLLHEEQWIQLECFGLQEHKADLERGHLFCSCDDQCVDVQELSHAQFLNSVCSLDHHVVGQVGLKEQIRNILLNAVVIRFSQLCLLLGNSKSSDQVLQCVGVMATLVQSCWVVKSDILYKDGSYSDFNGISCDVLRSARDHMLFCFTKSRLIKRSQVSNIVNLPKEEMLQIMEGVSTWQPGQGWQFKLEYDEEFTSQYPLIVKQYTDQWKLFHNKSTVTPTKTLGDSSKSLVTVCTDNTTAVTTHTATPSGVANQGEPLTGDDLVAVVKTVVDRSVMKLSTLKQSLHLLHHKVDHSDLMEALQVADIIEIDCKWLATSDKEQTRFFTRSQVGDCTDKYRPLLLELLHYHDTVTYRELASKVQEKLSEKPPRDTLLRLLKDMCIHKGTSKWTINPPR